MNFGRRGFLGGAAWAASHRTALGAGLESLGLYNVHEHLIPERERVAQRIDFFTLVGHYALNDVISAGLAGDDLATVKDANAPPEKRWKAFEPYWKAARFTGYGQALAIAIADIYGVKEISGATLPQIDDAIARRNQPGLYDYILKDRAKIDWCLVDPYWNRKPAPRRQAVFPAVAEVRRVHRAAVAQGHRRPGRDLRRFHRLAGGPQKGPGEHLRAGAEGRHGGGEVRARPTARTALP